MFCLVGSALPLLCLIRAECLENLMPHRRRYELNLLLPMFMDLLNR